MTLETASSADQGLGDMGGLEALSHSKIEYLPSELHNSRPWGPGNAPPASVAEFGHENPHFEVDRRMDGIFTIWGITRAALPRRFREG